MMRWDADVYQGDLLVARIARTDTGSRLEFEPAVLTSPPSFPGRLAWKLPYTAEPVVQVGDNVHPFFANLLPEGARLALLLESVRVAKDDFLGLLLEVGWDAVGDVAVVPHGTPAGKPAALPEPKPISELSLWEAFYAGTRPGAMDSGIPGVQEKLSDATVVFGARGAGRPASILKLSPKRYPNIVQNEEFFLRMAADCGLKTARGELVHDREGECGLLVSRFDRRKAGRTGIEKLHQEDACQLLATMPANKYHVSLRDVAEELARACTAPIPEIAALLRLYAFSFLIANADLHAKNISLLWENGLVRLSPAYDLLSTAPYPKLDRHMALKMDGKDLSFAVQDFSRFGKRFGIPEAAVLDDLRRLCARSEPWLDRLDEIGFDAETAEKLHREIAARRAALKP
jgi:serine/threonine-protein kinase HipA